MTPGFTRLPDPRRDPLVRAVAALRPVPTRILLATGAGSLALGCAIGLMATSAWLISRAAQQPPIVVLTVAVVATRAFGIGRGVFRYVERLVAHDVALRGVVGLRERLYRGLADADPAQVAGLRRGDLLARVGADVDELADVVVRSVLPACVAATTGLVTAALLALALPEAGVAVAVGLAVAGVLAPSLAGWGAARAERDAALLRTRITTETHALLDGLAELTVAGAVPTRLDRLTRLHSRLAHRTDTAARPSALGAALGTLATGVTTLVCLVLGSRAVADGRLPEVMLAVVTLTPVAVAEAVLPLPAAAVGLVRARAAARRVLDLLDAPPADHRRGANVVPPGRPGAPVPELPPPAAPVAAVPRPPRLRATGLACGWPGAEPVLTGVELDLPPGRRVAIVGPSGGGKTTLLLTLAGLLVPRAGRVTLSEAGRADVPETDLADVPETELTRVISLTAEDAHVFGTTVRENLRVARPDAADAELAEALARAGLGDWLDSLPAGLDTLLGADGTDVSGGERRRLLLARALLVGADVLLLDEPTEHLDPEVADALLRDLLDAGPTVVVVTHRISGAAVADEIVVVGQGTIAARGSHDELILTSPGYRESWQNEQSAQAEQAAPTGERTAPEEANRARVPPTGTGRVAPGRPGS